VRVLPGKRIASVVDTTCFRRPSALISCTNTQEMRSRSSDGATVPGSVARTRGRTQRNRPRSTSTVDSIHLGPRPLLRQRGRHAGRAYPFTCSADTIGTPRSRSRKG
jgi:hypothetical protein